jgi:hypothetical protein
MVLGIVDLDDRVWLGTRSLALSAEVEVVAHRALEARASQRGLVALIAAHAVMSWLRAQSGSGDGSGTTHLEQKLLGAL